MQTSQESTVLHKDSPNPPEKTIMQAPVKYPNNISSEGRILIRGKEPILRSQLAYCFI